MAPYTLLFNQIDKTKLAMVGGKGANLGELTRIDGVQIPDGFCITTDAFKEIISNNEATNSLIKALCDLKADDRKPINEAGTKIRKLIEETPIPESIENEIIRHLEKLDKNTAYAVRSSATAEDLPTASFAGQQESYLNIIGKESILKHISKCWASLFTDRAVTYRIQNGFNHRKVHLAVVVQKMVFPKAAGILFTADPVTNNRKTLSIDASFGLGEAMVSGLVNPDIYKVENKKIIDKKISAKRLAIYALKDGGTKEEVIDDAMQNSQAITDAQIIELADIGRKIEAHFGNPQDIEWCLDDDLFYIVQSRPITTLFPIPEVHDKENHVYVSVGHQQMMTDAMKPLGLSFFLLTSPPHMRTAGGRLFVDITQMLASPAGRNGLMATLGKSDPLIKDALNTIMNREGFIKILPDKPAKSNNPMPAGSVPVPIENDLAIVTGLIQGSQTAIEDLKQKIQTKSGPALFDFIREDVKQSMQMRANPKNMGAILAGINTSSWINDKMNEWLGEKNAADALTQSVPNNITSEMGLALLNLADVIRPFPQVIDYLHHVKDDNFLNDLPLFDGGLQTRDAIHSFLNKYGMRGAGEIDITKPRWSEKPTILIPLILSNIKNFEPGEARRKFEQGLKEAKKKENELLFQLALLPNGDEKAEETKEMISRLRNFMGYREYPKYDIVSRYFIYKHALLKESEGLVNEGIIHKKQDIFYLNFDELEQVVRTHKLDNNIITKRKEDYRQFKKLCAPRMMTSDGEFITGIYKHEDLPAGAFAGLVVSSGIIEGRARVILNMEEADIEEGDILVTAFTDPSWTPLFVSIKGLVTEAGGIMTHGAVIAREYGLPAVVGVEHATTLIKDGQRIRVNGTEGWVEIL